MKFNTIARLAPFALIALVAAACSDTTTVASPEDLAPPLGLTSITGDQAILLQWQASNYGEDRQGFFVYRADGAQSGTPETIPAAFGTVPVDTLDTTSDAGHFSIDVDKLANGTTYSFLVVAFKDDGNKISRPSNIIVDTPRIESANALNLVNGTGNQRYLDVNTQSVQSSLNSPLPADILCESFDPGAGARHGMVGVNGARVQDLGYVQSWDEIDAAPEGTGSYPAAEFSVQALPGHVYAVFTGDGHYAKLYVTAVNPINVNFGFSCRVAFQPQGGNPELKPGQPKN